MSNWMKFKRLQGHDGSWAAFEDQWLQKCATYGEELSSYYNATLSMMRSHATSTDGSTDQDVFGLVDDSEEFHGVCFLNLAEQKGYDGPVLRVLNFIMSPYYDFEDLRIEDYSDVFASYFAAVFEVSLSKMPSKHVKIHLRSPNDRQVFSALERVAVNRFHILRP